MEVEKKGSCVILPNFRFPILPCSKTSLGIGLAYSDQALLPFPRHILVSRGREQGSTYSCAAAAAGADCVTYLSMQLQLYASVNTVGDCFDESLPDQGRARWKAPVVTNLKGAKPSEQLR